MLWHILGCLRTSTRDFLLLIKTIYIVACMECNVYCVVHIFILFYFHKCPKSFASWVYNIYLYRCSQYMQIVISLSTAIYEIYNILTAFIRCSIHHIEELINCLKSLNRHVAEISNVGISNQIHLERVWTATKF
jgi:hypothetical protein